jgi:hypothetical protein
VPRNLTDSGNSSRIDHGKKIRRYKMVGLAFVGATNAQNIGYI